MSLQSSALGAYLTSFLRLRFKTTRWRCLINRACTVLRILPAGTAGLRKAKIATQV